MFSWLHQLLCPRGYVQLLPGDVTVEGPQAECLVEEVCDSNSDVPIRSERSAFLASPGDERSRLSQKYGWPHLYPEHLHVCPFSQLLSRNLPK
ncbi:hypothetical protein C0J52_09072 [Blattella germanica]|nr:hypothetical protein C0J52_09072 [Blattella germanica]